MKKFRFKLESVLKLRKRIEKDKQMVVAQRLQKVVITEQEIQHTLDKESNFRKEIEKISHGSMPIQTISFFETQIHILNKQREFFKKRLEKEKEELLKAQAELAQAAKNAKIFEKLKERKMEEFRIDANKAELKELDEVPTMTFSKKRNNPKS